MNGKQAKKLRKEATGKEEKLQVHYFVEKDEEGNTKESLVPMPTQYEESSYRHQYQTLKKRFYCK